MKSQGLPINFIVLAAVAILILILIVGFVIGGGAAFERNIAPGVARSNCDRWCSSLQQQASINTQENFGTNDIGSSYCTNTQVVDGQPNVYCHITGGTPPVDATNLNHRCLLSFADGTSRYANCTHTG